jgi:predicted dehydrogenase
MDKIRWGVLGTAKIGREKVIPATQCSQFGRVTAIASRDLARAKATAAQLGIEKAYGSYQELLADRNVDAVYIPLPNHLHVRWSMRSLSAGKHVLCEKPMAPTVEDAEAMVAAAKASGRETGIGFVFRRSPAIAGIRDQLATGAIGRPLHFNGHYWCDYGCDPRAPMSWRYKGGPGSGALSDIGSHLIDLAEFVCGPIRSVRGAVLPTVIPERALPVGAAGGGGRRARAAPAPRAARATVPCPQEARTR